MRFSSRSASALVNRNRKEESPLIFLRSTGFQDCLIHVEELVSSHQVRVSTNRFVRSVREWFSLGSRHENDHMFHEYSTSTLLDVDFHSHSIERAVLRFLFRIIRVVISMNSSRKRFAKCRRTDEMQTNCHHHSSTLTSFVCRN